MYETLSADQCRDFVEQCPRKLMKPYSRDDRPYDTVETDEAAACMVCLDCIERTKLDFPRLCKVKERPGYFKFTVESTGALKPEEIVKRAVEVLKRKLADITANLNQASRELDGA